MTVDTKNYYGRITISEQGGTAPAGNARKRGGENDDDQRTA